MFILTKSSSMLIACSQTRMYYKIVFNFTLRHEYAFKSSQTRWPLIGLRNLILIGQLGIWWKQTKAFFHTFAAVNNSNAACNFIQNKKYKLKRQIACVNRSVKLQFGVYIYLDLCKSATTDVNFTYGNHSIIQDSALWPMGFKMLRSMRGYLVWGLNRDVMRN